MQLLHSVGENIWFDHTIKSQKTPRKNVLSLSGGGVKGILPLIVLGEIEKRVSKKAGDIFDLTAATSVGCLTSSLLYLRDKEHPDQHKYSAQDLIKIMDPKIKTMFHQSFLNELESGGSLFAPKYTSEGRDAVLTELFGNTLAKDLMGEYCYTSFDTNDFKQSHFKFTSRRALHDPLWQKLEVKEMLSAAMAAPTYFAPEKIVLDKEYNLVDGGLILNNPSVSAYVEAKKIFDCEKNVTLLSLGTGNTNFHLKDTNWGELHWGTWILSAMLTGQDSTARDLTEDLLNIQGSPKQFYNVQFDIPEGRDALDDASDQNISDLKEIAKTWIESDQGDALLRDVCKKL